MLSMITIPSTAQCDQAISLMLHHKVHHLVVVDNQNNPVGTLSDRDIFYRWFHQLEVNSKSLNALPVTSAMRTQTPIIRPETTLDETLGWMKDWDTSILLIQTQSGSWGVLTERDLLNLLFKIFQKNTIARQLILDTQSQLASPLVQRLIEMVTQMGI